MLNRIILMGRLAADPELRTTPNGVSVVSFRIGVTRDYNRDQTDWINIVAWRQTAEFVSKYFFKGSMIALEGSLQSRQYQDRDGNNRTAYEVRALLLIREKAALPPRRNIPPSQGLTRPKPPTPRSRWAIWKIMKTWAAPMPNCPSDALSGWSGTEPLPWKGMVNYGKNEQPRQTQPQKSLRILRR